MNIISPGDLELNYLRKERKLVSFLNNYFFYTCFFLTILIFAGAFQSQSALSTGYNYLIINGFKNFYILSFCLTGITGLSLVSIFLPKKSNLTYLIFSSISVWGMLLIFLFKSFTELVLHLEIAFFIPCVLMGGAFFLYFSRKDKYKNIALALFSIFFWGGYTYIFLNRNSFKTEILGYFWELKLPFMWIFIITISFYFPKADSINWHLLFNPAQITRGTIWPSGTEWNLNQSEKRSLWIHGALNILLALIMLNTKMLIESFIDLGSLGFFNRVSLIQFMRILTDIGICNILTGIARMFGFRVPDATSFVLLARTPADFWRRGSVYTYQFVMRAIFLPVVRITKNRYFAVFVAFLFFYTNRLGFERFFGNLSNFSFDDSMKIDSLIFLAYYFNIIITQRYWFISKDKMRNSFYAWISVLLTHSFNVLLVVLARTVVKVL